MSVVTSDEPGATLPCGASTDALLEQVADGLGDELSGHQVGCEFCQAALRDLGARWARVEAARGVPVDPPADLAASIKAAIRRQAGRG